MSIMLTKEIESTFSISITMGSFMLKVGMIAIDSSFKTQIIVIVKLN